MKIVAKIINFLFFLLIVFLLFTPAITKSPINAKASNLDDNRLAARLNVRSKSIVRDKSFDLKVYNVPSKAKITYKSSDVKVASVNNLGQIQAKKVGNAVITVTIRDGSILTNLTCNIKVGPPAVSIKSNKARIILGLKESDILKVIIKPNNTAEDAKFSSFDANIASITSSGRITGKSLGHTYIFAEIGELTNDTRKYTTSSVIVVDSDDLDDYVKFFEETKELDLIPDAHLNNALDNYFNSDGFKSPLSLNIYLRSIFDFNFLSNTDTIKDVTLSNLYKIDLRDIIFN